MNWNNLISKEAIDMRKTICERVAFETKNGATIYPPQDEIFRALELTPPEKVRVCIVGQDPYHSPGAANGLAFSVTKGQPIPPSLRNIYKELRADLGIEPPKSGDLTYWAAQGVLLLNTTLTVYAHQANSHSSWGWSMYTRSILQAVSNLESPTVFLLWGAFAQSLLSSIVQTPLVYQTPGIAIERRRRNAYILSSHPSPLSAAKKCKDTPAFLGSRPFSTTNRLLLDMGSSPIDWDLNKKG